MEAVINLLSNQEKMMDIIKNIATYVIYIYPGIISLYILYFLEAKNIKETNAFIVKAFATSYIYNLCLRQFIYYWDNQIIYNIVLGLVSIIIPYILYKIKYGNALSCICEALKIRTCIDGRQFELIKGEGEKYTFLKVYLKESNTIYIGYMENYDIEMGSENFIILTSYIKAKEKKDGNLKYIIKNKQNDANDKIYISCNEIKCIEKISQCKIDKYYE